MHAIPKLVINDGVTNIKLLVLHLRFVEIKYKCVKFDKLDHLDFAI